VHVVLRWERRTASLPRDVLLLPVCAHSSTGAPGPLTHPAMHARTATGPQLATVCSGRSSERPVSAYCNSTRGYGTQKFALQGTCSCAVVSLLLDTNLSANLVVHSTQEHVPLRAKFTFPRGYTLDTTAQCLMETDQIG
jgi:hypothetical protein